MQDIRPTPKVFKSRISVLLLGFIAAIFAYPAITVFHYKEYSGLYFLGVTLLIIFLLLFGTRYILSENKLYVKICWIIHFVSMDIKDIVSVERSYNPLSSPASSLKRLRINSIGARGVYISPVSEQEFLYILKKINPGIQASVSDKKAWYRIWDWDINNRKKSVITPDELQLIEPAMQQTGQAGADVTAMETPDRPKPWWAMEFPARPKTRRLLYILAAILIMIVMIRIGVTIFQAEQDPVVIILNHGIQIKSMYGLNVDFSDITGISLIEKSMMDIGGIVNSPRLIFDGYSVLRRSYKGSFRSYDHDLGDFLLFVQYKSSPTIWIECELKKDIYISFRDGKKTGMLYNELKAATGR